MGEEHHNSQSKQEWEGFQTLKTLDPELEAQVMTALGQIIDPELGVDIVNLGLVYKLLINQDNHLMVIMTLTTPFCPLADSIFEAVEKQLSMIPSITSSETKLTFEPVWTTECMSRFARIALGISKKQ